MQKHAYALSNKYFELIQALSFFLNIWFCEDCKKAQCVIKSHGFCFYQQEETMKVLKQTRLRLALVYRFTCLIITEKHY